MKNSIWIKRYRQAINLPTIKQTAGKHATAGMAQAIAHRAAKLAAWLKSS